MQRLQKRRTICAYNAKRCIPAKGTSLDMAIVKYSGRIDADTQAAFLLSRPRLRLPLRSILKTGFFAQPAWLKRPDQILLGITCCCFRRTDLTCNLPCAQHSRLNSSRNEPGSCGQIRSCWVWLGLASEEFAHKGTVLMQGQAALVLSLYAPELSSSLCSQFVFCWLDELLLGPQASCPSAVPHGRCISW